MNMDPGKLDPELEELLALEREIPTQPQDRRLAVLQDIERRVTLWPPHFMESSLKGFGYKAVALGLTSMAIGGLVGVYLGIQIAQDSTQEIFPEQIQETTEKQTASTEQPTTFVPTSNTPQEEVHPELEVIPNRRETPSASEMTARTEPQRRLSTLDRERELLDVAHAAIREGNPNDANSALQRYERLFPRGRMREERDVLEIQTLVLLRQTEQAHIQAQEFFSNYPQSLFRSRVESLVESRSTSE